MLLGLAVAYSQGNMDLALTSVCHTRTGARGQGLSGGVRRRLGRPALGDEARKVKTTLDLLTAVVGARPVLIGEPEIGVRRMGASLTLTVDQRKTGVVAGGGVDMRGGSELGGTDVGQCGCAAGYHRNEHHAGALTDTGGVLCRLRAVTHEGTGLLTTCGGLSLAGPVSRGYRLGGRTELGE